MLRGQQVGVIVPDFPEADGSQGKVATGHRGHWPQESFHGPRARTKGWLQPYHSLCHPGQPGHLVCFSDQLFQPSFYWWGNRAILILPTRFKSSHSTQQKSKTLSTFQEWKPMRWVFRQMHQGPSGERAGRVTRSSPGSLTHSLTGSTWITKVPRPQPSELPHPLA